MAEQNLFIYFLNFFYTDIAPLFMAARDGKLELVKALVGKGAKINALGAMQQIGKLTISVCKTTCLNDN